MRTAALALLVCVATGTAFADSAVCAGSARDCSAVADAEQRGVAGPDEKKKQAPAVTEVKAEIIVLHATNTGKGIDPDIGKIPELGEPPFSSYNSYKLLKRIEGFKLPKGEVKELVLPDRGKLSLTFKDTAKGKKAEDALRYLLDASIKKADGSDFLAGMGATALKGKYFFIAGQKYDGGVLVIGIKISG